MSEILANKITPVTGTTVTLGDSGDTFTIPSGVNITNSGTATGFGGGKVVQVVNFQTGAVATGTTVMPHDDTIPQNGEGNQFLSLAITPTNSSNKLLIQVVLGVSVSGAFEIGMALFQDSTTGALGALNQMRVQNNTQNILSVNHYMTAGTTSSTTFKIRVGGNGAGTWTFNGQSAARRYGGVEASSITITEITA